MPQSSQPFLVRSRRHSVRSVGGGDSDRDWYSGVKNAGWNGAFVTWAAAVVGFVTRELIRYPVQALDPLVVDPAYGPTRHRFRENFQM